MQLQEVTIATTIQITTATNNADTGYLIGSNRQTAQPHRSKEMRAKLKKPKVERPECSRRAHQSAPVDLQAQPLPQIPK